MFIRLFTALVACTVAVTTTRATETKILPLSGLGEPGEPPVFWDFKLDNGRRSGEWTTIRVPSCWETEGFGTFYYGTQGRGKPDTDPIIPKEQGTYRTKFTVPADWQDQAIRIVFEAAMTDTTVLINGRPAGPTHQGGFYRFHYDITSFVKIGVENTLEVLVSKESANTSVNRAERRGDYWTFGGIYRPVWLEGRPREYIEWTAIDAKADGSFSARVHFDGASPGARVTARIHDVSGKPVGNEIAATVEGKGQVALLQGRIDTPKTWTAETPHLYRVTFTLFAPQPWAPPSSWGAPGESPPSMPAPTILHTVTERFGFRTFEVRKNDGLYLNGTKIVLKGVNRHCFWPETGRTVTREQSYADARLIKAGNMNAVRMSHYPPDKHFLEACDELGLYVLDELAGWQGSYDTPTGARLIGQIVRRDVNHPSILFWDNGNEGGWNTDNDGEFAKWDPQKRPVLHPWAVHDEIDTNHYEKYDSTVKLSAGPQIFMPTEFLHGLYDGGIGAGFRDFWDVMGKSPTVAGGFFWVWSDEGVVRSDQGGRIDNFGNSAPDGMVGPHREPEGSYHAVKEIWSPVQITNFKFLLTEEPSRFEADIENCFNFTNLSACTFAWKALKTDRNDRTKRTVVAEGTFSGPALAPRASMHWKIPVDVARIQNGGGDSLYLTARDPSGLELWTWSVRNIRAVADDREFFETTKRLPVVASEEEGQFEFRANGAIVRIDKASGLVMHVSQEGRVSPLGELQVVGFKRKERTYETVALVSKLTAAALNKETGAYTAQFEGVLRSLTWTVDQSGALCLGYEYAYAGDIDVIGIRFDLPDSIIKSKRWLGRGPYRVWQNRQEGGVFDLHEVAFNDPIPGQTFAYPEFKGFFRDWRWLSLETTAGRITVENASKLPFFALGKMKSGEKDLITDWPDMGLAFLHAIPAIGTKFDFPEVLGPQSQPAKLNGVQRGTLIFRFE